MILKVGIPQVEADMHRAKNLIEMTTLTVTIIIEMIMRIALMGIRNMGAKADATPRRRKGNLPKSWACLIFNGYPTLPSRDRATKLCASMANSMGRCCNTSRAKPFTIKAKASSSPMPRCRQ